MIYIDGSTKNLFDIQIPRRYIFYIVFSLFNFKLPHIIINYNNLIIKYSVHTSFNILFVSIYQEK